MLEGSEPSRKEQRAKGSGPGCEPPVPTAERTEPDGGSNLRNFEPSNIRTPGDALQTPVQFIKGVGPRFAQGLERMGVLTVEDLIFHFPHRYEDRRNFRPLGRIFHGDTVVTCGKVVRATLERSARKGMTLMKA